MADTYEISSQAAETVFQNGTGVTMMRVEVRVKTDPPTIIPLRVPFAEYTPAKVDELASEAAAAILAVSDL